MSDILLDLSADHLVTAIEENMFSLLDVYRKGPLPKFVKKKQ